MDLVSRAQSIILKPKEEWVKIKAETATVSELFTKYAMILAAIPAVAQFIGYGVIGRRIPFVGWHRMGFGSALVYAVFTYVASLASVYVLALVINALAPTFNSQVGMISALKLAVYSMTPGWIAGVLFIIPYLGGLAFLGSLYGLYILYLGFATPMMETPKEKIMGYTVVTVIVAIVVAVVISLILSGIFITGAYRPM